MPKLNLGAGESWLDGWVNVDLSAGNENVDLSSFPWPYEDDSAGEILASHILEHFPKAIGRQFLSECYRILAPGGQLHIAVPDMDIFIDCKLAGDWSRVNGYAWKDFNWMFGGNETETRVEMRHAYMYNGETLTMMLMSAGFWQVNKREMLPIDNPAYEHISLYVTGVK